MENAKAKDNVDLICSVAELSGLFANSHDLQGFLHEVVNMVAAHMHAAVCSVYLYDEEAEELVLSATKGLNPDSVGKTRLKIGEGITGIALKELRPICEDEGKSNPYFKLIPGTREEEYTAFLAVPIVRGITRIGVLVVQDIRRGYFDDNDTKAMRAIASQLAGTIENARLLMSLHPVESFAPAHRKEPEIPGFVKGQAGTGGIARGPAASYGRLQVSAADQLIPDAAARKLTLDDFDRALRETEHELSELEEGMKDAMMDLAASMVFSAQILMLKDDSFSGEIRHRIQQGIAVTDAVKSVVEEFAELFEKNSNARVREKSQDIQDLGVRLLEHMIPNQHVTGHYDARIVIAGDLLPLDMLKIAAQGSAGLILTEGSLTAHLAILARSLSIPAIILKDERVFNIPDGTDVLIDANQCTLYVNPAPDLTAHYEELRVVNKNLERMEEERPEQTFTSDGQRVHMLANINLLSEVALAKKVHAEGVGLYRSEFPYLVRNDFPSEEEQYRIYRKLVEEMEDRPVNFRTLDVGGDKMLSYFPATNEDNPFLGLRAIRFSLRYTDVFAQQLRAFLRAGYEADIGIMFPLISSLDDFLKAREVVSSCAQQLCDEGADYNPKPRLGAMVELPSAVAVASELARHTDFLCLGTNDLVQYMLGVDRTNADVAEHYLAYHPAVLRALETVTLAAMSAGKDISICGEIAGDPRLIGFLIGIGIRKFSLDARKILVVQKAISQIDTSAAEKMAREILSLGTVAEIEEILNNEPSRTHI